MPHNWTDTGWESMSKGLVWKTGTVGRRGRFEVNVTDTEAQASSSIAQRFHKSSPIRSENHTLQDTDCNYTQSNNMPRSGFNNLACNPYCFHVARKEQHLNGGLRNLDCCMVHWLHTCKQLVMTLRQMLGHMDKYTANVKVESK